MCACDWLVKYQENTTAHQMLVHLRLVNVLDALMMVFQLKLINFTSNWQDWGTQQDWWVDQQNWWTEPLACSAPVWVCSVYEAT